MSIYLFACRGITVVLSLLVPAVFSAYVGATELTQSDDSVVNTGRHIFARNCAICHGADAKGGGDFATLLKVPPTDLTTLSGENDGYFPFERVFETISGNELLPAHGTREMPIWGQKFAREAENLGIEAKTLVRARILELIAFLVDVQQE